MLANVEQGIKKREEIYNCIVDFIKKNKFSPSVREICEMVGFKSTSSAYSHLKRLQIEGKISFNDESPRTIAVSGYAFVKIPDNMTQEQLEEKIQKMA